MKNINLNLVRVTEAGAIAASKFVGSGDKLGVENVEQVKLDFNF